MIRGIVRPFDAFIEHRSLTLELAKRDILMRYRGASFGLLWSIISPFLLLMVYTFAFGAVMGSRWPEIQAGEASFSIILFAALIVHGIFSECINKAPMLVLGNPGYVKKIVFPVDILPWPLVLSAIFHSAANLLVFMVLRLIMDGAFAWTFVFFPLVIFPLLLLCLAVSWFLAALGVYLRDITQITPMVSLAMLFLSTALLPLEAVPEHYRWVFYLNPLSFIIDQARAVLIWQQVPDLLGLTVYASISLLLVYAARYFFAICRRGFGDVL